MGHEQRSEWFRSGEDYVWPLFLDDARGGLYCVAVPADLPVGKMQRGFVDGAESLDDGSRSSAGGETFRRRRVFGRPGPIPWAD